MIIAVDFDGTIVENRYPRIGRELPAAIDTLLSLQKEQQHQIILWTVREGTLLDEAVSWCKKRGLEFYAVNKNHPEEKTPLSRKIKADLYIDDLNLGGMPHWNLIYRMILAHKSWDHYEQFYCNAFHMQKESYLKRNILLRLGTLFEENL